MTLIRLTAAAVLIPFGALAESDHLTAQCTTSALPAYHLICEDPELRGKADDVLQLQVLLSQIGVLLPVEAISEFDPKLVQQIQTDCLEADDARACAFAILDARVTRLQDVVSTLMGMD